MTKAKMQAAYDTWYSAEVQKSLDDIDTGNVITHEKAIQAAIRMGPNLTRK